MSSQLDAFICGSLKFIAGGNKCIVQYPHYFKEDKIYIDSFDEFIFNTYFQANTLSPSVQDAMLKRIRAKKTLTQLDVASIQSFRLYDFMNGKISFPQEIESRGNVILTSALSRKEKEIQIKVLENSFDYERMENMLARRELYINAFAQKNFSILKQNGARSIGNTCLSMI